MTIVRIISVGSTVLASLFDRVDMRIARRTRPSFSGDCRARRNSSRLS